MKARASALILMALLVGLLLQPTGTTTGAHTATGPEPGQPEPGWPEPGQLELGQPELAGQELVLRMRIGTFDPLRTTHADVQSVGNGAALRLVQFPGPIQREWHSALVDAGLEVVAYLPDYAYLVWGTAEQLRRTGETAPVRWDGGYHPAYALHPGLLEGSQPADDDEWVEVAVQVYNHTGVDEVLADLHDWAAHLLMPAMQAQSTTIIGLQLPRVRLADLAALPGVISVEPLLTPERLDEVQGQLIAGNLNATGSEPVGPGYLNWLTSTVGLPALPSAYPIVDITDDGIDDGDAQPVHADFYELGDPARPDRLVYNANWTSDPAADGAGGHGNLNASIVGGYNAQTGWHYEDTPGYNYGLGINPFGRIAGSKIFSNAGYWAFPNYSDMLAHSYTQGARIVSNSWGDSKGSGLYLLEDQIYDGLVRDAGTSIPGLQAMTIIFAAGNGGPGSSTTGSPGNAKNVITVGASESYRPTWMDGCWVGSTGADNANDIISFSSRGPTADGRAKPDLVAPGTHIVGAASQATTYNGMAVCDAYYPSDQTLYAASSGTSHATPAVAGAASLLTRFYQDRFGTYPSPAMLKAYLINSARYLEGVGSGDTLPSDNQGFGSVNLGLAFDATPRLIQDQSTLFQATGDSIEINGSVVHTDQPFRVTLVWTDAPGSTVGASYVNNLDLEVTIGGQTYYGNVFSGAYSVPGGSTDFRNNVENIFLPAGVQGDFTLKVTATNLPGDGVPGNDHMTDQDFALVCYNCQATPSFRLAADPAAQSICQSASASYTIATEPVAAFNESITLQAAGHPTHSTAGLTPNPVEAGRESTLTITDTGSVAPGSYRITITGTARTQTKSVSVDLAIHTLVPTHATLLSPPQGELNLPIQPVLVWSAVDGAELYVVEVATSTNFLNLVYAATSTVPEHTVTARLEPATQYYWRVRAQNACGPGAASAVKSFMTAEPLSIIYLPSLFRSAR